MNYVVIFLLACPFFLHSQEADTIQLDELVIEGKEYQRFSTGSNHQKIKITTSSATLDQALLGQNSIYFRSYGNQQLSSIVFRGASASQTNLLWHGVPANYATLGQMDFSQWPMWLVDELTLEAGGSGALYGSGSIGGTVLLDSNVPKVKPGIETRVGVGSFGNQFFGLKGSYSLGKFSGQTKFFTSSLDNNFPYLVNGEKVRQSNASVENKGVQQKFTYQIRNQTWHIDGQYSVNYREIQPSIYSSNSTDDLLTKNLRLGFIHQVEKVKSSFTSTVAYLRNYQKFNDNEVTRYDQFSLVSSYWFELNELTSFRIGSNINRYTASSDNYPKSFEDYQLAVFGSVEFLLLPWWRATLNLRHSFYKTNAPFTPSFGQSFTVYRKNDHALFIRTMVSKGFRFPTLNDLHWQPGGNPKLLPERSRTMESGLDWTYMASEMDHKISFTVYETKSRNWIQWLPDPEIGGLFSPRNYRKVALRGFEASWETKRKWANLEQSIKASYSYTLAVARINGDERQMPYTPLNTVSLTSKTESSWFSCSLITNYTGNRFVTLDNTSDQSVTGYFLFDIHLSGHLKFKKIQGIPSFKILNLFNTNYQNQLNRAMPGRNYQLSFTLKLD